VGQLSLNFPLPIMGEQEAFQVEIGGGPVIFGRPVEGLTPEVIPPPRRDATPPEDTAAGQDSDFLRFWQMYHIPRMGTINIPLETGDEFRHDGQAPDGREIPYYHLLFPGYPCILPPLVPLSIGQP
jgi:hypothetical protein